MLVIPIVLLLSTDRPRASSSSASSSSSSSSASSSSFRWSVALVVVMGVGFWISFWMYLSHRFVVTSAQQQSKNGGGGAAVTRGDGDGGGWNWLNECYGFLLSVPDLTPNIGLWWYFFTEMFDRFRAFFLIIFHTHTLAYVVPLFLRFRTEPVFLAHVLIAVYALFKPYPTIGDTAFAICFSVLQLPLVLPSKCEFALVVVVGCVGVGCCFLFVFFDDWTMMR